MRSHFRMLLLLLPFTLVALAYGQREPGYIMLFDGTDLTGWRYGKGEVLHKSTETADKRFFVKDGAIVAAAKDKDGNKGQKDLTTVREFNKDFVLKLEFRAAQEAHHAVVIRGNFSLPVADFLRRSEQPQLTKFKNDGWNELEVVVKMCAHAENRMLSEADKLEATFENGKAVTKVNGRSVDPNTTWIGIRGFPKVNDQPMISYGHYGVATKGFISLRTGSGKMEYRNIRFRELQ